MNDIFSTVTATRVFKEGRMNTFAGVAPEIAIAALYPILEEAEDEATMIKILEGFHISNDLPRHCAFEQMHEDLTDGQRKFLDSYTTKWEDLEDEGKI